ncbi:MAG: ribosome maturation factor RimM [Bacteroidota bacterium]|jgi:16S rRNA processing protein RimM
MKKEIFPDREQLHLCGKIVRKIGYKGELLLELQEGYEKVLKKNTWIFVEINHAPVPFLLTDLQSRSTHELVIKPEIPCPHWMDVITGALCYTQLSGKKKNADIFSSFIGFVVVDKQLGEIGRVTEVMEYPMQWILTVKDEKAETMIPWTEGIISKVDKKDKTIFCDLPEGLYNLNSSSHV